MATSKPAIVYIDGYNLYYGLCEANWRRYLWLDVWKLGEQIIPPEHQLVCVKYFTARVSEPEDKKCRQANYLDAIATNGAVHIISGRHKKQEHKCVKCGYVNCTTVEKRTDVNIAVAMLGDAYDGKFDTAILVTGDTDFCDLVSAICGDSHARARGDVVVGFPPRRYNNELRRVATNCFRIEQRHLRRAQFPDDVQVAPNVTVSRPDTWTLEFDEESTRKKLQHEDRRGGIDATAGTGTSFDDLLRKAKKAEKAKKPSKAQRATKAKKATKSKAKRRR